MYLNRKANDLELDEEKKEGKKGNIQEETN